MEANTDSDSLTPAPSTPSSTSPSNEQFDPGSTADSGQHGLSTATEQAVLSTIRKRSRTSGVWEYGHQKLFEGAVVRHGRNAVWVCDNCQHELSNTGAAKHHLWYSHRISVAGYTGEADQAAKRAKTSRVQGLGSIEASLARSEALSTELRTRQQNEFLYSVINQQQLHDSVVRLLTMRNLPHSAVEWPELKALLMCVNPMIESKWMKSRAAAPRLISDAFQIQKQGIRTLLHQTETRIHLAFDIWTSPNYKSLMAVVAHFVDTHSCRLHKALIALPEVADHTGETMSTKLFDVLTDYDIKTQLGFICADNASANDKAVRLLAEKLNSDENMTMEWNPTIHRIRCLGHILNLAVQAFLFAEDEEAVDEAERQINIDNVDIESEALFTHDGGRKAGFARTTSPLVKLHHIQVHTRSSPQHYTRFIALAGRTLPADNVTRWNSWYALLHCACEDSMRPAIITYVDDYPELDSDRLNRTDWEVLHSTRNFLLPFDAASKRLQRDDVTLDEILWTMDVIVKHYETEKVRVSAQPQFLVALLTSWYAFDKYYAMTSDTPAYAAALLLHPSRRQKYIKDNWRRPWIQPALRAVEELWVQRYRQRVINTPEKSPEVEREPDAFDKAARLLDVDLNHDELNAFICQLPTRLPEGATALSWWLQPDRRQEWPRLSFMAIEILSIPGLSDEPERVFSGGRRTCRWDRASLNAASIERAELLKSVQRSGITGEKSLIVA